MVTKRGAALRARHAQDHALVLAKRAMKASAPPDAWWARPDLTWDQWSALAATAAERMNAVMTTQHVRREDGDR